jgi:hypothetical protein
MKILVLYFKWRHKKGRNTVDEHLYSFRKYVRGVKFHYFNAANGIPWYLSLCDYDAVILHYTFLAIRWRKDLYTEWMKTVKNLKKISAYFLAIPQDEYAESSALCDFFKEYGVRTVFTCFSPEDYEKVYPREKVDLDQVFTVFPGYMDEDAAKRLHIAYGKSKHRPIDLGYRARKVPYWLGRHGQYKHEIGEVFAERASGSGLKLDISTGEENVFLGKEWYKFISRCRAFLGCEGGASLFDPTGAVRYSVERYLEDHPGASFQEVEKNCFPGKDYNINLFTLSPRHFECAITKTCQVLLEGKYGGIFLPGVHYIEVKKDYSNIDDVIEQIADVRHCKQIAENAYRDIVQSGRYTYRVFAEQVISHIAEKVEKEIRQRAVNQRFYLVVGRYLSFREYLEPALVKMFYAWFGIKFYGKKIIGNSR